MVNCVIVEDREGKEVAAWFNLAKHDYAVFNPRDVTGGSGPVAVEHALMSFLEQHNPQIVVFDWDLEAPDALYAGDSLCRAVHIACPGMALVVVTRLDIGVLEVAEKWGAQQAWRKTWRPGTTPQPAPNDVINNFTNLRTTSPRFAQARSRTV